MWNEMWRKDKSEKKKQVDILSILVLQNDTIK